MNVFDIWLPWIQFSARMTAVWYGTTPERFRQEWQLAFAKQYWGWK